MKMTHMNSIAPMEMSKGSYFISQSSSPIGGIQSARHNGGRGGYCMNCGENENINDRRRMRKRSGSLEEYRLPKDWDLNSNRRTQWKYVDYCDNCEEEKGEEEYEDNERFNQQSTSSIKEHETTNNFTIVNEIITIVHPNITRESEEEEEEEVISSVIVEEIEEEEDDEKSMKSKLEKQRTIRDEWDEIPIEVKDREKSFEERVENEMELEEAKKWKERQSSSSEEESEGTIVSIKMEKKILTPDDWKKEIEMEARQRKMEQSRLDPKSALKIEEPKSITMPITDSPSPPARPIFRRRASSAGELMTSSNIQQPFWYLEEGEGEIVEEEKVDQQNRVIEENGEDEENNRRGLGCSSFFTAPFRLFCGIFGKKKKNVRI